MRHLISFFQEYLDLIMVLLFLRCVVVRLLHAMMNGALGEWPLGLLIGMVLGAFGLGFLVPRLIKESLR